MNEVRAPRLAIVGGGPMCLYALERLAALLSNEARRRSAPRIMVFERSGNFGAGEVNSDGQPATSLMNRVTAQVGFAADESNRDVGSLLPKVLRPTLHEWLQQRLEESGDPAFALRAGDIPTRRLHGAALKAAFRVYTDLLRAAGADIEQHAAEVVDVSTIHGGVAPFLVHTAHGAALPADRVLFVTGNAHSFAPPAVAVPRPFAGGPRIIAQVYPLDRQVTPATVPPGCVVGLDGLGLTAIDTILHLSEGRGGRFEALTQNPGLPPKFAYKPSGHEPAAIIAFSPSGMPPCCRPENFKLIDPGLHYCGRFFTSEAVHRLRVSRGRPARQSDGRVMRQLDFDQSVLPVVVLEMSRAYYKALLGEDFCARFDRTVHDRCEAFLDGGGPHGDEAVSFLLAPVQACLDDGPTGLATGARRFDWKRLIEPLAPGPRTDGEPWESRLARFMAWDLANGQEGNLSNPVKAACDGVLRDLRRVFCEVVDHGGLTPSSHQRFLAGFMRQYMRLSNGAGIVPTAKLLALIEHGLLDVSIGPQPVVALDGDGFLLRGSHTDVTRRVPLVLQAKLAPFDAADPATPLYPNLLRRGLVRRWTNTGTSGESFCPGGLDLTSRFHPLRADGGAETRLTFMGPPAEGQRFFQSAAARPNCDSSIFTALATWARECMDGDHEGEQVAQTEGELYR